MTDPSYQCAFAPEAPRRRPRPDPVRAGRGRLRVAPGGSGRLESYWFRAVFRYMYTSNATVTPAETETALASCRLLVFL
jgi:hypothetical protein